MDENYDLMRDGDNGEWSSIYKRYRRYVTVIINNTLNPKYKPYIEDIMNETFYRAYVKIDLYDRQKPFHSWLGVICKRISIAYNIYLSKRYCINLDNTKDFMSIEWIDPEKICIKNNMNYQFEKCIDNNFNDKHASVLKKRFLEESTYNEISDECDIPINTVKSIIHNQQDKMKNILSIYLN